MDANSRRRALQAIACFNPRARDGRELFAWSVDATGVFQSTRP